MLMGLIRPTAGHASVLGEAPGNPRGLAGIGALIEYPAFYPHLSGRDNLRVLARSCGMPDSRVERALAQVELAERGGDRFRAYSQGMKQRLGTAAALLKDCELLILDEPTNGMDPSGMAAMRELIRSLGSAGRTVLLSSHLLGEVEQVCDRVGVIQQGRLIAEGSVAELTSSLDAGRLMITASPRQRAAEVLRRHPSVRAVRQEGEDLLVSAPVELIGALNRELVLAEVTVTHLRAVRHSLEEVFLELTVDQEPAAVPS
ncbi:ATP-binding cassette domain-containing protein [Crossiella sp. SN42]|uniref:ATP-binding cassette domain-containing protein n=1 Tax=Crossiella sp. SN42 TaxID=2944808 RepID=UPI00207C580D|nr:ATP-binding cassette domain-containing protein [Crossiella sp. SN42]MCO1577913.1 ATP-binding cassette domain-containing protein [Crossiella sp. SN42]